MQIVVHTPINDLTESIDFYTKLGFANVSNSDKTLFTEGTTLIEINPDRFSRAGIKLYKTGWEDDLNKLREITHVEAYEGGYLLSDPNGVAIYLEPADNGLAKINSNTKSVLGNYAGLTLEAIDIKRSAALYELLGFEKTNGDADSGFVTYTQAEFSITLLGPRKCPHLFFNPSMTFFNGKENPAIIQKVRDFGIPITEEITYFNPQGEVDNIIIRDPGGYGFFLFND